MSVTKYLAQTASQKTDLFGLGVQGFYLSLQERHGRAHGSRRRVCRLLHNSRHEAEKTDQNRLAAGKGFKGLLPAICFCQTGSSPQCFLRLQNPSTPAGDRASKPCLGRGFCSQTMTMSKNHEDRVNIRKSANVSCVAISGVAPHAQVPSCFLY